MVESTQYRRLSDLSAWADNYSSNDVSIIARSIREFGMNSALRVWKDTVMAGNHTYKALLLIRQEGPKPELDHAWPPTNIVVDDDGAWWVQFVDVSHLSEIEVRAFAIADNNLARKAVVDEKLLAQYLRDIAASSQSAFTATGYDARGLELLLKSIGEKAQTGEDKGARFEEAERFRDEWGVKPGQLWVIPSLTAQHPHRLLVGDSTSAADVQRLMAGRRAALFATDPPYAVDYSGDDRPKAGKNWSEYFVDGGEAEGRVLYEGFISQAIDHAILDNAAWYCWHASSRTPMLAEIWAKHDVLMHQMIVWKKDRSTMTHSWYRWAHEPCMFGWRRTNKPPRTAIDNLTTVWEYPSPTVGTERNHPTPKPVELFIIPMEQHTVAGDVCYEPFSGSGSQFVAGEKAGRSVYGMEIQPLFAAVILQRLKEMGLAPQLDDG